MNALLLSLVLTAPPAPDAGALKPTMQAALSALVGLQPLLESPIAFRDPSQADRVRAALDVLGPLQHAASQDVGVGELFARELSSARTEFSSAQTESARRRLKSITALCYGCHLRTPVEKDVQAAAPLVQAAALSPLERATFFASTRQFDRALAEWDKALSAAPKNDVEAFEQTQSLRSALAVAIQGKDDARAAVALLQKHHERPALPAFARRLMSLWLTDAQAWQAEGFAVAKATPTELLAKARALVEKTGAATWASVDESKLVSHLRAATCAEEALRREPTAPFRQEALYLLGVLQASTVDPALWRLEWLTLERCIRENPKSPVAKQCLERLRERTFAAYTGRAGVDVPAGVLGDLGVLTALTR